MPTNEKTCPHVDFLAHNEVHRLENNDGVVDGFMVDIKIQCADCKHFFKFIGLKYGLDLAGAAMDVTAECASLAISPDGHPSKSPLRGFGIKRIDGDQP